MKTKLTPLAALFLLLFSSCAEKPLWISTEGVVTLERDEIRELHEAFKTTSEKTITFEKRKQEVECDGMVCSLPVKAKAKYRKKDNSLTEKTVEAKLVFGRDDAKNILELLERARSEHTGITLSGRHGSVRCDKAECEINFALSNELRGYSREALQ